MALGIALVQTVFVLIGLAIASWQVRSQRVRQVEDFYLQRYWQLIDRLSDASLRSQPPAGKLKLKDQRAIRLYFRLSEDEADARAQGWVSDATWRVWRAAMINLTKREPYLSQWAEAVADSDSGLDYRFSHLRRMLTGDVGETYDPPATVWYRRLSRRLPWRSF